MKINILGKSEKYSSLSKINYYLEKALASDNALENTSNYEINISHNYPPLLNVEGDGYWVTIQPWEFGAIPKNWVPLFNETVDEIWVPSTYVSEVYKAGGVDVNKFYVIPNGYDDNVYTVKDNRNTKSLFRFLYVGGTIGRKGIDLLLNAFCQEFGVNDQVELLIKDFGTLQSYAGQNFRERIHDIMHTYRNIKYIDTKLSESEMAALYQSADCLVQPYRGEGFGMPILEAMGCGLPVIVTKGGASDDFVLDGLGYKIKSRRINIGDTVSEMSLQGDGWLLEPDFMHLKNTMLEVYNNREQAKLIGLKANQFVRDNYTWDIVGRKVKERLFKIFKAEPIPIRKNNKTYSATNSAMSLGRLGKAITLYDNGNHIEAFIDCLKCITQRPFHPEAYLQMIEIVLDKNDYITAKTISGILLGLTPEWDIAININNKLKEFRKTDTAIEWPSLPESLLGQRLSVCLITKNEEHNIRRCLDSICDIADQIIVVDTGSDDNTKTIAASYDAEIYDHEWKDDFAEARNRCLEYAHGDWVLFLDADEELAAGSVDTLKEDMGQTNILVYRVRLKNIDSPLTGYNYVPRLVRNAPGLHFIGKIHETMHASAIVIMRQWGMEQAMGKTLIYHYGYTPEELARKNKTKRNLTLYEDALKELPDDASIMMNYAHDLNIDGQSEKAHEVHRKVLAIFEKSETKHVTPEVREQFIHNYGVFLAMQLKMKELAELMATRTARDTGPVANVHYMSGLGLMNCNRYEEAIPELEAAINKAFDKTLAPSVSEVRTWKVKHLLANCHASIGDELTALKLWEEIIMECKDSTEPFHDYARYLSTLNRNKEALDILLKGLKVEGETQKIWELGCGIVNKDPELAEFSLEWTRDAFKRHPDSDVTKVRRGESLMKNGRFDEAVDYFDDLSSRGERNAIAAQLLCKQLSNQCDEKEKEVAHAMEKEINGWIEVLGKAPLDFDRKRAERLLS